MKTQKEKNDEYDDFIKDVNKKIAELRLKFSTLDKENKERFLIEVKKIYPNATINLMVASKLF